jgi:type IV pilus assembly protein PilM
MPIAVGLDVGSEAVRAAAVQTRGSPPALQRFGEVRLPEGAVVTGSIVDADAVVAAIRALWKRHHFPHKRVVAGVAGPQLAVFRTEAPDLPEKELVGSLPALVENRLPMAVEEAVLDYLPLQRTVTPEGEAKLSLLVVAVPRAAVDTLLEVTRRAGVEVLSVDLQAFGLVRGAFGTAAPPEDDESCALLDIGATLTQLAVVRRGVIRFVRDLPVGGRRFTEALVDGAGMGWEEAEDLKRRIGLVPAGLPAGGDEGVRVAGLLGRAADEFIAEIAAAVGDYLVEVGEGSLARVVVLGNGARLPHLASRLGRILGTRVEPARVLDHVAVGRTGLSEAQLLSLQPVLPAAVGLALWGSFAAPPPEGPTTPVRTEPPGE